MFRLIFVSIAFFISLSFNNTIAQDVHSIQLNGGILFPRSSSNGVSTFIQYNHSLSPTFNLYIYTGYSSWDRFYVTYIEELSAVQKQQYYNSYSSKNHILIPLYAGAKINLYTNKLFTSFINFEIGYSYFSYDSYNNIRVVDQTTGEVLSYKVDESSKEQKKENLYGIGIGAGLSHPITKSLDVVLSYRLNSNFNTGNFGLFSAKGTYSTLYAGLNIKI